VPESTCAGPGCIDGPMIDGLCLEHYFEPLLPRVAAFRPGAGQRVDPIIRFLGYSDRSGGPDACWLWTSSIHPQQGFGTIFDGDAKPRVQKAHRWAYAHFIGPIPEGREVGHACCTEDCPTPGDGDPHRRCVNPRHLRLKDEPGRYAHDCARCGKSFTRHYAVKGDRIFCSMKCRSGGRMVTKTCHVCGKDFTIPLSNDDRYQTCSAACKNADTEYVNCERCGKRFAWRHRNSKRHCSEACRRPPLMIPCQTCGKEFRISACERESKRFCSIACVRQFMGETRLEARVRVALEILGVGFTQEYPFRRWSIDFAIPEHKIAIEADGNYWHTILAARDARRDASMHVAGWTVVRLAETEVKAARDLGQFILTRVHEATGLDLADIIGPAVRGSRQLRPAFQQRGRRAGRPAKGQMSLWP
jgi:very-short-patch-repair endonuclease